MNHSTVLPPTVANLRTHPLADERIRDTLRGLTLAGRPHRIIKVPLSGPYFSLDHVLGMELAGHIKNSSHDVSAFTRGLCEASLPLEEISLSPDEKEQVIEESADFLSRCISDLPLDLYVLFQLGCVLFRSYVLLRYGRSFTSLPQSSRKAAFSDFAYNRFGPFRKLFKVVRVTSLTSFYETGPVKAFLEDSSGGDPR